MTPRRITAAQVVLVRSELLKQQGYKCALCQSPLGPRTKKDPCLDHDHATGYIRDVLCRNCNQMEGKVFNLANRAKAGLSVLGWLENFVVYHRRHETPQHGGVLHHTHRTEEQKRLDRNYKARARRAAAKAENK